MFRYWIGLILSFSFSQSIAQYPFYADGYDPNTTQIEVCAGENFTLTGTHGFTSEIYYFFNYPEISLTNPGTVNTGSVLNAPPYNYTNEGVYSIGVTGNPNPGGLVKTRTDYVKVLPKPVPAFEIRKCLGNKVSVVITDATYDEYIVNYGDASSVTTTGGQTVEHTYSANATYTITVTGNHILNDLANSRCGNVLQQNVVIDGTLSDATPTVDLGTTPSYCEGTAKISFNVNKGYKYELWEITNTTSYQLLTTLNFGEGTTSPFVFTQNNINTLTTTRRYEVRQYDVCGNPAVSIFSPIYNQAVDPATVPRKLINLNATVREDIGIRVTWDKTSAVNMPDLQQYTILRGGKKVTTLKDADLYIDEALPHPKAVYCYQIEYVTSCGVQTLFSDEICTIFLEGDAQGTDVNLNWTPYVNPANEVVNYTVVQLNEIDGTISRTDVGTDLFYDGSTTDTTSQILRFRIDGKTASGFISESNIYEINRPAKLFFPTAFTPNQDGLNDTFFPKGLFVKTFQMTVYNQNGLKLFSSDSIYKGWSGQYNNTEQPSGSYLYTAQMEDYQGRTYKYNGTFVLIR